MGRTRVGIGSADALSRYGLANLLRARGDLVLLLDVDLPQAQVLVVAQLRFDRAELARYRALLENPAAPVVLVAGPIQPQEQVAAVQDGVVAFLARADLTARQIHEAVQAASATQPTLIQAAG
ncbi:hypothetical protein AB0P21_19650 [Kribbella sp. NPDC056861]|uniref:hypothetical protein n=1 Tax=Kribbella sp. NPDC056861 TaxID=3154857 RepID=UPI003443D5F5